MKSNPKNGFEAKMGDPFFAAGVIATKICPLHAQTSSRCSTTSLDSVKINTIYRRFH
jgi:hypothetical protein